MDTGNIMSASFCGKFQFIDSQNSCLTNDLTEEQIRNKIFEEYEFFCADEQYFSARDRAKFSLELYGAGVSGGIPVNNG